MRKLASMMAISGLATLSAFTAAEANSDTMRAMIARHAADNQVPFALANAMVRIESRYNPQARNKANLGLTQISHRTARGLGYGGSAAGLFNADTNLKYGIKYLAMAYRLAGGNVCGTVMRYQSGLGATRMNKANRVYCAKVNALIGKGEDSES